MSSTLHRSPGDACGESDVPMIHVHLTRRRLALLAILLIVPWLIAGFWPMASQLGRAAAKLAVGGAFGNGSAGSGTSPDVIQGNPGPWGHVDYRPLIIDLPDEFVFVPPANRPAIRWFFQGYSKEQALEFLRSSGVAAADLERLAHTAKWTNSLEGAAVEPGDELILGLDPAARAKIYSTLVEFPQNAQQMDPIWFRPDHVKQRVEDSPLAPQSIKLVKKLLYAQGDATLLFADFEPALRQLPDDPERRRMVKTLSRKETFLMRVKLDADSDVEALGNYWGVGGRRKDLIPLLSAARRAENGCRLNVIFLLPHFGRDHLYNHPYAATDAKGAKQDCFWSAFNFFNEVPDDRVSDMAYLRDLLKSDYYAILEPSQLGDLVFLTTPDETAIHAAAFVADDVVFTKNGESITQPWILMRISDMIETYSVRHPHSGPLQVKYFRNKSL
ncbi:MAG: hypothetical protein ABSF26_25365 [Thermoguttaceae bacterium]